MDILVTLVIALAFLFITNGAKKGKVNKDEVSAGTGINTSRPDSHRPAAAAQQRAYASQRPAAAAQQRSYASQRPAAGLQKQTAVSKQTAAAPQKQTSIVERAKSNAAKLADDETKKEIELSHGHSESNTPEVHEHSRNCQELKKDPEAVSVPESQLGTIEDLMVKGYDGNLQFERDFIGEAQTMLSHISMPDTEVPDFSLPDPKLPV